MSPFSGLQNNFKIIQKYHQLNKKHTQFSIMISFIMGNDPSRQSGPLWKSNCSKNLKTRNTPTKNFKETFTSLRGNFQPLFFAKPVFESFIFAGLLCIDVLLYYLDELETDHELMAWHFTFRFSGREQKSWFYWLKQLIQVLNKQFNTKPWHNQLQVWLSIKCSLSEMKLLFYTCCKIMHSFQKVAQVFNQTKMCFGKYVLVICVIFGQQWFSLLDSLLRPLTGACLIGFWDV